MSGKASLPWSSPCLTLCCFAKQGSRLDEWLEAAPEHALGVERHRLRVHVAQARILHGFGIDLVAVRARAVSSDADEHGLVRLEIDALRKRCDLSGRGIVGLDLEERQRAVLAPHLAEQLGALAIFTNVAVGDWNNINLDVASHFSLLCCYA